MSTRSTVTHFGGDSSPTQSNAIYVGTITAVASAYKAKVKIPALNITVGPCRAIDGVSLEKNRQVLCMFTNGRFSDAVIIGTFVNDGTVGGVTGPTGPNPITVGATSPTPPASGDLWFDSNTGKLYTYYDSYWVDISGPPGPTGPAGSSPTDGDMVISSRIFAR